MLIYKGFEDNERNEREKRNVTFALHLLYVWVRFERCLKGIALHRGGECYVLGCSDGCVGVSWASGRVWLLMWVLYRLDMEMGAGGA